MIFATDEVPPLITCPALRTVSLSDVQPSQDYTLQRSLFTISDTDPTPSFNIINPTNLQTTFTVADLYRTFTYTAEASDSQGNRATCQSQIFVTGDTTSL